MQTKWKKAFLWSSLGGLTIGAVAAAVLDRRRRKEAPSLEVRAIPRGSSRVVLWTERFPVDQQGGIRRAAHDAYVLEPTPFKVWSVLERPSAAGAEETGGSTIYHVTCVRYFDPAAPGGEEEEQLIDRFYGTVAIRDVEGNRHARNRVARGGILELAKCLVGGSVNGIETGESHRSAAPILNFRFESRSGAEAQ